MPIYKICRREEWARAEEDGVYAGSELDRADGFIHFSLAPQVAGTLAKFYAGDDELVLAAIDPAPLGAALRYEPSRGGALFPHLYAVLPLTAAIWAKPIVRGTDGIFLLPEECV
jgi:uncharacterized protein (DUF952 family)